MQSLEVHTHLIFTQIIKCQSGQIVIHHTVLLLCSITQPTKDWQHFAFPIFFRFSLAPSDRLWGEGGGKERKKKRRMRWDGCNDILKGKMHKGKEKKGWARFEKSAAARNHLTFPFFPPQDAANVIKKKPTSQKEDFVKYGDGRENKSWLGTSEKPLISAGDIFMMTCPWKNTFQEIIRWGCAILTINFSFPKCIPLQKEKGKRKKNDLVMLVLFPLETLSTIIRSWSSPTFLVSWA